MSDLAEPVQPIQPIQPVDYRTHSPAIQPSTTKEPENLAVQQPVDAQQCTLQIGVNSCNATQNAFTEAEGKMALLLQAIQRR